MSSPTIIICNVHEDPFARVSRELLDDASLTWEAKGILAYLLGKPKDWKLRVQDIIKHGPAGKMKVRNALNNMREAGYAIYEKPKTIGAEGVWKVSDSPIFPKIPRRTTLRDDVNRYRTKKEEQSTKKESAPASKGEPPFSFGACKAKVVPAGARKAISSAWKPDKRTKAEMLSELSPPKEYPSQREFDEFVSLYAPKVFDHRPEYYRELCERKWHVWKPKLNRWVPIRDWRKLLEGLQETMELATIAN